MPNLDTVGTDDDDDDVMSFIEEIARLIRESDGTEQGSLRYGALSFPIFGAVSF
jgi:hypothetical protein